MRSSNSSRPRTPTPWGWRSSRLRRRAGRPSLGRWCTAIRRAGCRTTWRRSDSSGREVEPLWLSASSWLDREVERLQAAVARKAGSEVVKQVEMPGRIEASDLALPSHTQDSGRLRVGGSLQLIPLVAASPAGGWGDDYGDVVLSLRYPVPLQVRGHTPGAAIRLAGSSLGPTSSSHPSGADDAQAPGPARRAAVLRAQRRDPSSGSAGGGSAGNARTSGPAFGRAADRTGHGAIGAVRPRVGLGTAAAARKYGSSTHVPAARGT